MTRTPEKPETEMLESAFAKLRDSEVPPSDNLVARILADAAQAMPAQVDVVPQVASGAGWFKDLLDGIGGWRGGAALTASAVLGLSIGLSDLSGDLLASATFGSDDTVLLDGYSNLFDDTLSEG